MPQQRIAIIGGGPTGLALAYFLLRAGRAVTIIEKGPVISGLLAFTAVAGQPIERYYHHFFTTDQYLLDLLEELELNDRVMWREPASAVYRDRHLHPLVTKVDYARLPWLGLGTKIRAGLAAMAIRRQRPDDLPAELTAETYLRRLFGSSGWDTMWQPLLVNKFGADDASRISAQWIAKRIQLRSGSERHGREVLGYLGGSYRVLFDGLRVAIEKLGGRIVLNQEVTHLKRGPSGEWRIADQAYDVVVGTIAPGLMKKIMPDLDLPSVTYRGAIVPLFRFRTSLTPYYWINILDQSVPFSVVVNQQALVPPNTYGGEWPVYVGHYVAESSELFSKTDAELAEYYLAHLRKMWPGLDRELLGYEIGRTKNAQPVVTAPWTPLSQVTNVPNLYLTSMAHIFPEDRGVNYAIREARRLTALLTAQPR